MALPDDMQTANLVLWRAHVQQLDELAQRRRQSRSELIRDMIAFALPAFFVAASSEYRTFDAPKEQTELEAA